MSKKLYIIVALVFLCGSVRASDSLYLDWSQEDAKVPYRIYDSDGDKLPPQAIEVIHQKDCCPYGWKFNIYEWWDIKTFPTPPEYDRDPVHGSNGGISRA